jgi:hypothetical protein
MNCLNLKIKEKNQKNYFKFSHKEINLPHNLFFKIKKPIKIILKYAKYPFLKKKINLEIKNISRTELNNKLL